MRKLTMIGAAVTAQRAHKPISSRNMLFAGTIHSSPLAPGLDAFGRPPDASPGEEVRPVSVLRGPDEGHDRVSYPKTLERRR